MDDKTIRQVILLGTLAIIGIIMVQTYWLWNAWDTEDYAFDRSARIALRQTAEELAAFDSLPLPDKDLIVRKYSNYYFVNFNNEIDRGNLEHYLYKHFEKQSITSDFRYGIYDCSTNEMVDGGLCKIAEGGGSRPLIAKLPEHTSDEFIYYFSIEFLGRSATILHKMQLSIIFTAILLFAIVFFIYSMFVILKQKRLSEMQKDFINNMTHEFKTPISTINVSADVFMNAPQIKGNKRLERYASIIKEQNQRLNNQVEKVLQVAKMEKENFRLTLEQVDLNALIEDIVDSAGIKIQEVGGSITSHLSPSQPTIQADKLHLTNIMYNLIDNSIKYCKDKPVIRIRTRRDGNTVVLSIEDEGIGISKEHTSKIFDKFFRVPTGNVHNVKGFGLGLFYVKNIIKAHGWGIKIDSKVDQGTIFYVSMNVT